MVDNAVTLREVQCPLSKHTVPVILSQTLMELFYDAMELQMWKRALFNKLQMIAKLIFSYDSSFDKLTPGLCAYVSSVYLT